MGDEIVKVQSTRFGELEVPADSVFEVIDGLIGFPDDKRYILLDHNPPFSWMQSLDSPELAFVVLSASEFGDHYKVPLPWKDEVLALEKDKEEDIAVVNLVSVRPEPTETTVNLKAPIVVNLKNRKGRQVVIDSAGYSTRFPLWAPSEPEKK